VSRKLAPSGGWQTAAAAVVRRVVEDEEEDAVVDEEVVQEEDLIRTSLSDEEADSSGPVSKTANDQWSGWCLRGR
jgi:hypothetical protein